MFFRYCFDEKLVTKRRAQEALLTDPEQHMPS
jgi:hypothetical protein